MIVLYLQLHNLLIWTTSETWMHNIKMERRPIVRATHDKVRVICGGPVSPNYWKLFEHRKQTYRYRGESLWSRMFVLIKVHFEPRISCFLIVLVFLCMVSLTNDYYYSCYKNIYIRLTNFMKNNCWKLEYIFCYFGKWYKCFLLWKMNIFDVRIIVLINLQNLESIIFKFDFQSSMLLINLCYKNRLFSEISIFRNIPNIIDIENICSITIFILTSIF